MRNSRGLPSAWKMFRALYTVKDPFCDLFAFAFPSSETFPRYLES